MLRDATEARQVKGHCRVRQVYEPLLKTARLLAVSEERENSFPVDPHREFQALVNQNKWDRLFSALTQLAGDEGVRWGCQDGVRKTEGSGRLCVFTSHMVDDIVSLSVNLDCSRHPAN